MLNKLLIMCFLLGGLLIPFHVQAGNLIPDPNAGTYTNVQAQPCANPANLKVSGPSAGQSEAVQCTVNNISNRIISIVFYLMGAIAVLLLIFAGIQYILSNGNPDGIKKSRATIMNVILGIVVLTAAYAIINLIIGAVGYFNPAIK